MRLTRGGTALVGLMAGVLALSASSGPALFVVLAFFGALLLVNVPYAYLALGGLDVRRDHPSHVREGSAVSVRLHVLNRNRTTRILLRLFDVTPGLVPLGPAQVPILPAGQAQSAVYRCAAARRGVYAFTRCRVETSAPFGLVTARRTLPAVSQLVVYPLYYDLAGAAFPFRKTFAGLSAAPGARPGEGLNFFGIREYRHGDPIRKIHWPSTVRTGRMMVKEFEEDLHSSVVVLIDTCEASVTSCGNDTNLEVAIRAAASLANHMLVNGHPVQLMALDHETGAVRTDRATGDLTPILDGLARLRPSRFGPNPLLDASERGAAKHSNWIVILLSADADALTRLLSARSRGTEIVVVVVDERSAGGHVRRPDPGEGLLAMCERAGINLIHLSPGDDIQSGLSMKLRGPRRGNW